MANETFLERVQKHERDWGNQSYTGRPSLMQIMTAPVVIVWEHKDAKIGETITLHATLEEVERYFLRLLITRVGLDGEKRISDIFEHQKRMTIKSVSIEFGEAED